MMTIKYLYLYVIALLFLAVQAQAADYKTIELSQYPSTKPMTLGELDTAKPTYIKMWATWCKPCMEQMPHFEELSQRYRDQINIVAVNININENTQQIADVIKRFNLTMPVWLDNKGKLGVALGLVGTPYSVLINTDGNVVYTTHESDANLDKFLAQLARGQKLEAAPTEVLTEQQRQDIIAPWLKGEHLLFFSATWCDWYLADSRPDMAKNCKEAQTKLNALHKQLINKSWHGFVNHLWTDEVALAEFNKQYDMNINFSIDTLGILFNEFTIRSIPTLIKIKDGRVVARITDFSNLNAIAKQISSEK